jgi:hypothetical protein
MVYNTQNYWVFGLFSIVLYSKRLGKLTFQKLDLFPSSGEGGKTPTQLGPLKRANPVILSVHNLFAPN